MFNDPTIQRFNDRLDVSRLKWFGSAVIGALFAAFPAFIHAQQGMLSERWQNEQPMLNIDLFRKEINLRPPDVLSQTSSGLSFIEVEGNHGTRLRAHLIAPQTADYTFFVAGDDQVEFWLSSDDTPINRKRICWSQEFTSTLWDKFPSQRSRAIRLQQGQSYYIEGLMSNWGGSDYLALGWKRSAPAVFNEVIWGGADGAWAQSLTEDVFSVSSGVLENEGLFRHREWTGKGEFIVKVSDLNNPDPTAMAGLMMRANPSATSP